TGLLIGFLSIWYFFFEWVPFWDLTSIGEFPPELHSYHYIIGAIGVIIALVLVLYNLTLIINVIYQICRLYIEAYRSRSE
ncbi:hypothetical protein CHH67_21015, partial [Paenibacillus campinasensis]